MSGDGRSHMGRAFGGVRRWWARTTAALARRPDAPAPAAHTASRTLWAKLAPIGGRMSAAESGFDRAPPLVVPVGPALPAPAPPAPEPSPSPVDTLAVTGGAPYPRTRAVALAEDIRDFHGQGPPMSLVALMSTIGCDADFIQAQLDKEVKTYEAVWLLKKAGVSVQKVVKLAGSSAEAVRQLALLVDGLEGLEPEPAQQEFVEQEPVGQAAVQALEEAGVPATDGTLDASEKPDDAFELVSEASSVQAHGEAGMPAQPEDVAAPQDRASIGIGKTTFAERLQFWEGKIAAGSASSLVQTDSGAWDSASEEMQLVVGPPAVQAQAEAGAGDDKLSVYGSEADSDTLRGRSSDDLSPSTPTDSMEDTLMGLPDADTMEPHAGSTGAEEVGWFKGPHTSRPAPSLGRLSSLRRFGRSQGAQSAQ
ncbi:hypothetical protein DFJ74DRAFT_707509 [Hyaloraphidium curvatum]|nr:hypothetical protein DFJ74DRAFT_707509 [Hyaloraphidium curvatum]